MDSKKYADSYAKQVNLYASILGFCHSIGPFHGLDISFVSGCAGVEELAVLNRWGKTSEAFFSVDQDSA